MTLNVCKIGHETHESKLVESQFGPWWIWDWAKYQWQGDYCSGQDEVSKSIDVNGYWEKADTDHMLDILKEQPGDVLDFGSHIGWFTVQALESGCDVQAFDADPENMRLLDKNAARISGGGNLSWTLHWVVNLFVHENFTNDHVRLMKVDIEGHEHEALNKTRHLWQQQKIDYGLWELSPIFEKRDGIMADSYAALVDEIASYGYRWYILKGDDRWYIEGKDLTFPQENAWAERV